MKLRLLNSALEDLDRGRSFYERQAEGLGAYFLDSLFSEIDSLVLFGGIHREEVSFTKGRVIVRGQVSVRGEPKRADYVLSYKPGLPLAIVEAKDNNHSVGAGMQQALEYSDILDVRFVFSSNGDAFLFHDKTGQSDPVEREIALDEFPSADDLWRRYSVWKGLTPAQEVVVSQPYFPQAPDKAPRYYQEIAINRAIEAIAKGEKRILLSENAVTRLRRAGYSSSSRGGSRSSSKSGQVSNEYRPAYN